MRQPLVVALILALVSATVAPASAETVSKEYVVAIGARAAGAGTSVTVCAGTEDSPDGCDLIEDDRPELRTIGGGRLFATTAHRNVVATAHDQGPWGTNAALAICLFHPDGDFICDEGEDIAITPDCGTAIITNAGFPSRSVAAFLFNVVVSDDLDVCGDTIGMVTADFF